MDKISQKKINKANRKRGSAFEKYGADFLDMDVVPYSGSNARFGYGDVRDSIWLGEFKNITPDDKGQVTIKQDWFKKNLQRAKDIDHLPFLAWMPRGKSDKYVILDVATFIMLGQTNIAHIQLPKKVHNTRNLIININAGYVIALKPTNGIIAISIEGDNEIYYMMHMALFKKLINDRGLKGKRQII